MRSEDRRGHTADELRRLWLAYCLLKRTAGGAQVIFEEVVAEPQHVPESPGIRHIASALLEQRNTVVDAVRLPRQNDAAKAVDMLRSRIEVGHDIAHVCEPRIDTV